MSKAKLQFELGLADAALVASWIDDIILKGVPSSDAPAFRRLEKALKKPLLNRARK